MDDTSQAIPVTPVREVPRNPECCGVAMRESVIPGPLGPVTLFVCAKQCGRHINKSTLTKMPNAKPASR